MPNDPIPTPDPEDLTDDPLTKRNDSIFARRELLRIGHVPDSDRIVGRDAEIKDIEELLQPGVFGDPPGNAIVYGKTGSGKSLVSRHVTGRVRAIAQTNDVSLISAYIDCDQANTITRVARSLSQQAEYQSTRSLGIPDKGIGSSEYMDYLYTLLDDADVLIAIIDEIDKLGDDEILFKLSRAEESGKTGCYIGVVAISNKIEYYENLDERVKSSFQDDELVFHPYDAGQIREILSKRRDAFQPDVLEEGVIPRVAALAAREHGDARKAIEILSSAGKLAARNGDSGVTEEHVDAAQDYAEMSRFQELIRGSTPHSKYVLFALAYLQKSSLKQAFSTGEIYRVYEDVCTSEGTDPLSHQRVLELLKEWAFSDVTENRHTGGGKSEGSYREHSLLRDSDMVLDTVFEQPKTKQNIVSDLQNS
ncbi:Cdc6/Cdc18 family protein [Haladaptatus sp. CMAA 1911]|uniref:Cdc6/Cdc18 family protein n=1 Tax=unclassified Haladaptatus TaxID=2622732 RepID=UPI003754FF8A